ncbi:peroxiredoxin [Desulfovibrio sp. TomC]|uniref:peroxiredoxin n=1 Tax=Desulfovibrio sp. TomC TaxID=1562888 RepID=UPI000575DE10|nr:peroxiredoxin [Desulfovibrio sp. TomC]KHK00828.1 Alkyl hydroperoxide reductase subunit C-like protein [Desulfovibrio sp. TomC]
MTESASVCVPRIGDPAPDFEAETTHGILRLEDFRGSWLVLFSHPADFTPVCASELIAFAGVRDTLRKSGCELLGLSVDSIFSHIAWVRSLEEKFGVVIDFPLIADTTGEMARRYGMTMPAESATEPARVVFVIDDRQFIRAFMAYPMTTGRNVEEIMRLVAALQATDAHGVATPAGWKPGEGVLAPPPRTQAMAEERAKAAGPSCPDWYFCKRELS